MATENKREITVDIDETISQNIHCVPPIGWLTRKARAILSIFSPITYSKHQYSNRIQVIFQPRSTKENSFPLIKIDKNQLNIRQTYSTLHSKARLDKDNEIEKCIPKRIHLKFTKLKPIHT